MVATFEVGAFDWQQPAWQEDYYPDEMPDEWRLTFYANEFRCVLVPAQRWRDADAGAWSEEVNDPFRFYFELAQPDDVLRLARLIPDLQPALAGAVILQQHDELIEQASELTLPIYSVACGAQRVLPLWQKDTAVPSSCSLGWVPATALPANARQLRELVEAFIGQAPRGEQASLIFDRGVAVQTLRDAMVIASLLAPA